MESKISKQDEKDLGAILEYAIHNESQNFYEMIMEGGYEDEIPEEVVFELEDMTDEDEIDKRLEELSKDVNIMHPFAICVRLRKSLLEGK